MALSTVVLSAILRIHSKIIEFEKLYHALNCIVTKLKEWKCFEKWKIFSTIKIKNEKLCVDYRLWNTF